MIPIELLLVSLMLAGPFGAPARRQATAAEAFGPHLVAALLETEPATRGASESVGADPRRQAQVGDVPTGPEHRGGPKPPEPDGLTPLDLSGQSGQVTSANAFNPAISVIPDMLYYNDGRQGRGPELIAEADGFHTGNGEEGGHSHGGALAPGFNLREVELALSGSVDPYFDAVAYVTFGGGEVEIEEAFVRTRRLPAGLQIKAGRFLSDIGYINRQHPHQWSLANQNLAHELVLAGGLGETGVQVSWLPSLPIYLQVGSEWLQGENVAIASYLGPDDEHPFYSHAAGPRLVTGFAKLAPDLGYNHALQIGGSIARGRRYQVEDEGTALEGTTWLLGFDGVYKYDSPRPYGEGDVVLQGEYLRRTRSLFVFDDAEPVMTGRQLDTAQDGFYVQASYGLAPRWTAAVRFDAAGLTNRVDLAGTVPVDHGASRRFSAGLAFDPTEFSRLRFQVDRASMVVGGSRESFTQAFVQLQISLGVHGAHRF